MMSDGQSSEGGSSVGGTRSAAASSVSSVSAGTGVVGATRRLVRGSFEVLSSLHAGPRPRWLISTAVAVAECSQLLLFALDAPGSARGRSGAVRGVRYLSAAPSRNWQAALLSLLGAFLAAQAALAVAIARAKVAPSRSALGGLSLMFEATGALAVPALHAGLSFAVCPFGKQSQELSYFPQLPCWQGDQIGLGVAGLVVAALAVVSLAYRCLCLYPIVHNSRHPYARLFPVGDVLFAAAQVLLTVGTDLTYYAYNSWLHNVVISSTLVVFGVGLLASVAAFLPYYNTTGNYLRAGTGLACAFQGSANLAMMGAGFASGVAYAVLGGAALCGFAVGVAVVVVRKRFLPSLPASASCDVSLERSVSSIHGEQHVRHPLQKEVAEQMLLTFVERFEHSAWAKLLYAQFIVESKEDKGILIVMSRRIRERGPNLLVDFYLTCLERIRRSASAGGKGASSEEIEVYLAAAERQKKKLRRKVNEFWRCILTEENTADLSRVLAHVSHYEKKTTQILLRLLALFPNSPRVLRAYGQYLEDIERDTLEAGRYYTQAEEIEEREARNKRRRFERKERRRGGSNKVYPSADDAPDTDPEPQTDTTTAGAAAGGPQAQGRGLKAKLKFRDTIEAFPGATEESGGAGRPERRKSESAPELEQISEAADQANADAIKYRTYRERIATIRSRSHRLMQVSVFVTPLVFIAFVVAMYLTTRVLIGQYVTAIDVIDNIEATQRHMHALTLYTRLLSYGIQTHDAERRKITIAHITARRLNWANVAAGMEQQLLQESDWAIQQQWKRMMPLKFYYKDSDVFSYQYMGLRSFNAYYLSTTQSMIDQGFPAAEWGSAVERSANFRFLADNLPWVVKSSYRNLSDAYLAKLEHSAQKSQVLLGIGIGVSLSVVVFVAAVLFRNAMLAARKEHVDVLRLFSDLPKHAVAQMATGGIKGGVDARGGEAGTARRGAESTVGVPVLRKILVRFAGCVAVMIALLIAIFVVAYQGIDQFKHYGPAFDASGGMMWLSRRMHWLAIELGASDFAMHRANATAGAAHAVANGTNATAAAYLPLTWPGGAAEILREATKSIEMFKAFQLTESTARGGLKSVASAKIADLLYTRPCQANADKYVFDHWNHTHLVPNCGNGMEALVTRMLNRLQEWYSMPEGSHNLSSGLYAEIHSLDLGQLTDWLQEALQDLQDVHDGSVRGIAQKASIVFALSFPVVLVTYLLLGQLVGQVREENVQTMRMLLMVPVAVLDSVSSIRTFLETGEHDSFAGKMVAALEESNVRTKSILEAAADAIIVMNEFGTIEVFNRAAEQMFGYRSEEIIGHNISQLLPATQACGVVKFHESLPGKENEGNALHKSGETLPIILSLSRGTFRGMARDELITENERLLGNMLPKTVAAKVQRMKPGTIIAKEYRDVSVLFADIVGFTAFAMERSALQLVSTLDSLFRGWDEMLDSHGVEKIKTIGDAYMGCVGAPVECAEHAYKIVEFAVDMFSVLQRHNRLSGDQEINIRVGINSGSVIGGVIGTRRMVFDLWGPVVNLASRMESTGVPGRIQVTEATQALLRDRYEFEARENVEVKGEGNMTTYLLVRKIETMMLTGTMTAASIQAAAAAASHRKISLRKEDN
eukprot:m51a1_g1940 putative adenylate guanylate cyclase (1618) ;mRNA; r:928142-933822